MHVTEYECGMMSLGDQRGVFVSQVTKTAESALSPLVLEEVRSFRHPVLAGGSRSCCIKGFGVVV